MEEGSTALLVMLAVLPLPGLVGVVGYRLTSHGTVRLWPFAPAAVLALLFTVTALDLALATGPNDAPIPVVPFLTGFFLPFVTLGCGLVSFVAIRPQRSS